MLWEVGKNKLQITRLYSFYSLNHTYNFQIAILFILNFNRRNCRISVCSYGTGTLL